MQQTGWTLRPRQPHRSQPARPARSLARPCSPTRAGGGSRRGLPSELRVLESAKTDRARRPERTRAAPGHRAVSRTGTSGETQTRAHTRQKGRSGCWPLARRSRCARHRSYERFWPPLSTPIPRMQKVLRGGSRDASSTRGLELLPPLSPPRSPRRPPRVRGTPPERGRAARRSSTRRRVPHAAATAADARPAAGRPRARRRPTKRRTSRATTSGGRRERARSRLENAPGRADDAGRGGTEEPPPRTRRRTTSRNAATRGRSRKKAAANAETQRRNAATTQPPNNNGSASLSRAQSLTHKHKHTPFPLPFPSLLFSPSPPHGLTRPPGASAPRSLARGRPRRRPPGAAGARKSCEDKATRLLERARPCG